MLGQFGRGGPDQRQVAGAVQADVVGTLARAGRGVLVLVAVALVLLCGCTARYWPWW